PARRGWRRWRPRGARGRRMASPITSFGDLCRVLGPFRGFVLARALDHQRLGVEGLTVEPAFHHHPAAVLEVVRTGAMVDHGHLPALILHQEAEPEVGRLVDDAPGGDVPGDAEALPGLGLLLGQRLADG